MSGKNGATPEGIAVIGVACRFPGARSADELWRNLRGGVESITFFSEDELKAAGVTPEQLRDPRFVGAKGVLDEADCFDAGFFGVSPREAALMDPQQRVFLETAWTALEDAGYDPRNFPGAIGVFAGSILSIYLVRNLWPNRDIVAAAGSFQTAVGNDTTFLATSTSYQLDLRGPSVSVGTACSTSLVAVHLACQSLLAYESDMALAGGVSVHLPLVGGYRYEDGGVLSPDGHCRPFDAAAQGTVSSDGVGIVVLKRLAEAIDDGDVIHAVILGSAINNDGRMKVGYTAPSVQGEAQVIAEAMAMAGVSPESISMVETHGAGTLLGDPIEVAALVEAFGNCGGRRNFCALSSVKSNIGHVDAAAGIAGLIKTVFALRHREIPPTLHFQRPNPQIDFTTSPFYVNRDLLAMPESGSPMRAGVSSFGIGGTNVHLVLEEPPLVSSEAESRPEDRPFDLITISARTPTALEAATDRLADHLEQAPELDLADVAFTLRHGRRAFVQRRALVCANREEAIAALRSRDPQRVMTAAVPAKRPSIAFMFPGLGDHYPGMGWEMYCTESKFRETVDRCAELLKRHLSSDIRDFLYPARDWSHPVLDRTAASASSSSNLDLRAMLGKTKKADAPPDHPASAQPAIFVTEVALAELIRSWGIEPEAMIGHSIGEFSAAYLSGVLSLPDAIEVVAARARLIESEVSPGAMLAVPLTEEELRPLLPDGVSLGAINAARLCIASGEEAGVSELAARLAERNVSCQRLRSTHAYHSAMMEAIVAPLTAVLQRVTLNAPRIPYVSCITGTWITDAEATDPRYWARHLCRTVRFQAGLAALLEEPQRVLFEVGPGQGLTSHAIAERSRVAGRQNAIIPSMRWSYGLQSELAVLLRGIGQLWLSGASLDTSRFFARERQRRVRLPAYPFERQRYWIDPPAAGQATAADTSARKKPDVADWFYLPCWKPSVRARPAEEAKGNWLIFADKNGVGAGLAEELRARGASVAIVVAGNAFRADDDAFAIDPARAEDYDQLIRALLAKGRAPETIVHLWSLTPVERAAPSSARFAELQQIGYYSLMRLLKALCREGLESSVRIEIVANQLLDVNGGDDVVPEKATLRAPAMVAPQEHPGLTCRCIDVDAQPDDERQRESLVAQLRDETLSEPTDPVVAYRRGLRWLPAYEPVKLQRPNVVSSAGGGAERKSPFRHRGVCLITGGLGGVGLILARHLAQSVQARLVLIGRSAFPDKSEWANWLANHDENDTTSGRIRQIQQLENLGSEVLVLRADVSNRDEMMCALAAVDGRFGELHGVIHAAGAVGIETFREIRQAGTADSESQFVAKVRGLMVLDEVLAGRPLDFCLLMSSLSAILGGLGFSAYSAANLFMDAFATWKSHRPKHHEISSLSSQRKALSQRERAARSAGEGTPRAARKQGDDDLARIEPRGERREGDPSPRRSAAALSRRERVNLLRALEARRRSLDADGSHPAEDRPNLQSSATWISVDWDSWRLADTRPVIAGLGATVSEFVMEPGEGADACERILAEGNLSQVVVSSGDLQTRLRLWIERGKRDTRPAGPRHERPSLMTSYAAPRGELERELAEIWQELFGIAEVGVHDNFFELGGHSLLATQLNARLSSRLHVEMSLKALLQAPTIAELAIAVVSSQAEQADPEALERMLAEIGDSELEGLIREEDLTSMTGGGDE